MESSTDSPQEQILYELSNLSILRMEEEESTLQTHEQLGQHTRATSRLMDAFYSLRQQKQRQNKPLSLSILRDFVQGCEWIAEYLTGLVGQRRLQDNEHDLDLDEKEERRDMIGHNEEKSIVGNQCEMVMHSVCLILQCLLENYDVFHDELQEERRTLVKPPMYCKLMVMIGQSIIVHQSAAIAFNQSPNDTDRAVDLLLRLMGKTGISPPSVFYKESAIDSNALGILTSFYGHRAVGSTFFPWGVIDKANCFMACCSAESSFMLLGEFTESKQSQLEHQLAFLLHLLEGLGRDSVQLCIPLSSHTLNPDTSSSFFLDRLCRLVVMAPSQLLSQQAYRLLHRIEETMVSSNQSLDFIGFLFSLPATPLVVMGIEFVKKGIKREWDVMEKCNSVAQKHSYILLSRQARNDLICPILFSKTSKLYRDSTLQTNSLDIFNDPLVFIDKLDIMMQALNLFQFLIIKRRDMHGRLRNNDIFPEEEQELIKSEFWNPALKAAKQVYASVLENGKVTRDVRTRKGQEFLNLVPLQIQLLQLQLESIA